MILPLIGSENEDAALLSTPVTPIVAKVDAFDAEMHMLPLMSYRHAGIKAFISPVSDVLVKGASPFAALISLRASQDMSEDSVRELYSGLLEAAARYNVRIVGGDTDIAERGHFRLDVFVIGTLSGKFLRRGGARVGDLVAITGTLGLSSVLYEAAYSHSNLACSLGETIVEDYAWGNLPDPRTWLEVKDYISAAIDNSDGLALSLHYISESSSVRIILNGKIPVNEYALRCFGSKAWFKALYYSGEEHNFVFTVPSDCEWVVDRLGATVIGRVDRGRGVVTSEGEEVKRFGWVSGAGYADRL